MDSGFLIVRQADFICKIAATAEILGEVKVRVARDRQLSKSFAGGNGM